MFPVGSALLTVTCNIFAEECTIGPATIDRLTIAKIACSSIGNCVGRNARSDKQT